MKPSFAPIKPLLQTGTNPLSRFFSYLGLGIGVLMLLASIQMFVNIRQLMGRTNIRKNGFDYISITKTITNDNMGRKEDILFNPADIEELRKQPFVSDVAPLISNAPKVRISGGALLPVSTDLFLESIDQAFLDTLPPSFRWAQGEQTVPIIVASDYLEMVNVFAPSQGLPQISPETAMLLPLQIELSGKRGDATFKGRVVGFSDRINSVLVPKEFLDWVNKNLDDVDGQGYSRLYVKTADANNTDLISYLDHRNYKVNKDKIKFGRAKQALQGIFSGLGVFGLLVVVMAMMLFSFYLQLVIARSRDSLQLLLLLGYSPRWLSTQVSRRFIPVYLIVVGAALVLTQLLQYFFHRYVMYNRPELDTVLHPAVMGTAVLLAFLCIFINGRMVKRLLHRMYQR